MIICLNGTSSSGKTSIAKKLQELITHYPLYFSIDNILYSLPSSALKKMTSGLRNPGLDYGKLEDSFYKCVKSLSLDGHTLIVDNSIVSVDSAKRMFKNLEGLNVVMIGISCSLDKLKKRELQRADRTIGEAESQFKNIHTYCKYDLHLDSTTNSPDHLVRSIFDFINGNTKFTGFLKTSEFIRLNHSS